MSAAVNAADLARSTALYIEAKALCLALWDRLNAAWPEGTRDQLERLLRLVERAERREERRYALRPDRKIWPARPQLQLVQGGRS